MQLKRLGLLILALAVTVGGLWAATRDNRDAVTVVVATKKLDRFTVVTDADITVKKRHISNGSNVAHAAANVRDKALLVAIERDGVVHTTDVASKDLLVGRSLLTVAVTASPDAPATGDRGTLIVSPRVEGFVGFVIRNVGVVRATRAGSSASYTLALRPEELDRLGPLLAVAELRLTPSQSPW